MESVRDRAASAARAVAEERIAGAIRRFQSGRGGERDAAFRVLYETYFRSVERFFARRGLAPDDALDLTQETFLGIYKALEAYEHRGRFAAWLFQAAKTTHLKWIRRHATAKRSAVEISRDAMDQPDRIASKPPSQLGGLLDAERKRALRNAVDALPEQMRDCLTLRLYHQLAYKEIAVVKKISVETVKAHLARARTRLREGLAGFAIGENDV